MNRLSQLVFLFVEAGFVIGCWLVLVKRIFVIEGILTRHCCMDWWRFDINCENEGTFCLFYSEKTDEVTNQIIDQVIHCDFECVYT